MARLNYDKQNFLYNMGKRLEGKGVITFDERMAFDALVEDVRNLLWGADRDYECCECHGLFRGVGYKVIDDGSGSRYTYCVTHKKPYTRVHGDSYFNEPGEIRVNADGSPFKAAK